MAESKFFQDDDDRAPTLAGWWDDLFPGEDMPGFLSPTPIAQEAPIAFGAPT